MKRGIAIILAFFVTIITIAITSQIFNIATPLMVIASTILIGVCALFIVILSADLLSWNEGNPGPLQFLYNTESPRKKIKYKRFIWLGIIILFIIGLISLCKNSVNDSIFMYNTSKTLHNSYIQKVQEKAGFYDKLWKTYLQKEQIADISKETFLCVTAIIMENRRDGQNVAWKWTKENQQIPYEEFTCFYKDLSNFIESQREGYFAIEKQCQNIANKNNTLLDTFPHNIYNKVLKCKPIIFEYGILSDSTRGVVKTKNENI